MWIRVGALATGALLAVGCGMNSQLRGPVSYRYFQTPGADDAWSAKIENWQARERSIDESDALVAPASVSEPGVGAAQPTSAKDDLRRAYVDFRVKERREVARAFARWIQSEARTHYIPDGPLDHWATLKGTLDRNGDDCDGLELLAYHFLRDMGFGDHAVYRAIVYRPSDGEHHMVTLWFENPNDPWVIDPTGAMTRGMPHMSEVSGWVPLEVFSETEEYAVRPAPPSSEPGVTLSSR